MQIAVVITHGHGLADDHRSARPATGKFFLFPDRRTRGLIERITLTPGPMRGQIDATQAASSMTLFSATLEQACQRVSVEEADFALAARLVTNGEWAAFIADGGYGDPRLWLSDGWAWVQREGIAAPLYWRDGDHFTHAGWQARDPEAPVTHISFYEADAFASWAGARLPTESEWEAVARGQQGEVAAHDPAGGNQLDGAAAPLPTGSDGLFGDGWQFTRSAYLPYPRFRVAEGAVGEYNGKFMSGQVVLRGASCATPRGHSRASYRNFFYPHQRWQFTGLRLAQDA